MKTYTLLSSDEAAATADELITASAPFNMEPWPDDEWRLSTREEHRPRIERRIGRELTVVALLLFFLLPLTATAQPAAPCRVNVNTASPVQLALLINTGPALASKIEAARKPEPLDAAKLDAVPGIGIKWLEYNAPHVAYSGETTCKDKLKKPAATPEGGTDGPKSEAAGN